MIEDRFVPYYGPDAEKLPTDKNHLQFKWTEPGVNVCASITRLGNGAPCHFTADWGGVCKLEQAINEFCEFVFCVFPWCTMIMSKTNRKSVIDLIKKCGFELVKQLEDGDFLHILTRGVFYG